MARLFIGTAGWGVPRDLAAAFPGEGPHLERFAKVLNAAEINSTFYRRHKPETFEKWRKLVPAPFRFAVKIPRTITHEAELKSPRAHLKAFFEDVSGLGKKLGVVLVQLPASVHFEAKHVRTFLKTLRSLYEGPVACEPRHASWYTIEVEKLFIEFDIARASADPPRPIDAVNPAGSSTFVYFRWHGSPRTYWSSYDDERLQALHLRIAQMPASTKVWCIFDNTASGAAAGDALRLRALFDRPKS